MIKYNISFVIQRITIYFLEKVEIFKIALNVFLNFSFRPTRRPLPIPQPDYRIHEMNKRLQQRTDESDNLWWDAFATEFFEDDAAITLTFCLEDGPKRYSKLS